jgi:hypothetical protein
VLYIPSARVTHHESSSFADPHHRLRIAHRNRYVYALPSFGEATFADAFLVAERTHLEREASFDEIRAVSGAAIEVLAELPYFASQRLPGADETDDVCATARPVLNQVRSICNSTLRAR